MFFKEKVKWIRIASSKDELENAIPMNRLKVFQTHAGAVCIGKNEYGLHAVRNKCPHQGFSFEGGWCTDDKKIVCPIHRYGFDTDTGRGGGSAVRVYKLDYREDGVYVGITSNPLF